MGLKRLKVLVSAYACSPLGGSEPGVGWGFVRTLSRNHDLWVLVEEEKFREEIEGIREREPDMFRSLNFVFIRKRRRRWLRRIWPPAYYWSYRAWHREAFTAARRLHREVGFDIAHQLTMVGFREPGYLWKLGIPFVWGPIGGMGFFPWRFLPSVGVYGSIYYFFYNLFNLFHMSFLPRPRRAARAAGMGHKTGLIAATSVNREGAQKYLKTDAILLSEAGLAWNPVSRLEERAAGEPLRLAWVGRHTPGKALNLALESLSRMPADVHWILDIVGEGPRTAAWRRLAAARGIDRRCRFHGKIPRKRVREVLRKSHLMLITSLRDLTSTVTVEALASGLPIVCLDHCGFSDAVDEGSGVKVPVTTPRRVIADFTREVEFLARNEDERRNLAMGALRRAELFEWERKLEILNGIYMSKVNREI